MLRLNQHFLGIKGQAFPLACIEHFISNFLWNVKQSVVLNRCINRQVQMLQGRLMIVTNLLVKLFVVLLADFLFRLCPNSSHFIDGLSLELDWMRDIIGIFADDRFQSVFITEFFGLIFQM